MGSWTRAEVAALVDHTLLKPEATEADVGALVAEAVDLGVYAVCVSPSMVVAAAAMRGRPARPSPRSSDSRPASTFRRSRRRRPRWPSRPGAREIDMVIDVGAAHRR